MLEPRSVQKYARIVLLSLLALLAFAIPAAPAGRLSRGQVLYVPVYSHVFSGDRALPFNLAATLSLRNCDLRQPIRIVAADYYDSSGKLLQRHLEKPLELPPLSSHSIFIKERDVSGGFGASFIVRWEAVTAVNPPVVESVMIGARSGQGISFTSPGRELFPAGFDGTEKPREPARHEP